MNALVINKNKFTSLQKYVLEKGVLSTECNLYMWYTNSSKKILKIYFIDEGLYFGNKLLTINTLIDNKEHINIDELILPEKLVIVNNKVVGFSMPFIDNINLKTILSDKSVPILEKIDYLKQVGQILEKIQRTTVHDKDFYLGDVHEANFLFDLKKKRICTVDLDSCKIANNKPFPIKYLSTNPNIKDMEYKYPKDDNIFHIPNADSEWMCYIFMILNTISNGEIHKFSASEYYVYLQYLRDLGVGNELLDCFYKIYTGSSNTSPCELLDQIPENIARAHHKVFKMVTQKR
jgi:serine/threonine protein kinase